jgi:lipoate-protein ligase A
MTTSPPGAIYCRRLPTFEGSASLALAGAEAILDALRANAVPAIRWYVVDPPAVILGASQSSRAVDMAACRRLALPVVKRAAGGTVVLADGGLLGLDIVLPRQHPLVLSDLTRSYEWLGATWLRALRALGVEAELVSIGRARAKAAEAGEALLARLACFGGLSPFEVTMGDRKVVGLAQVRRGHGVLLQCGILLRWSPHPLADLLTVDVDDRRHLDRTLGERIAAARDHRGRPLERDAVVATMEAQLIEGGLRLTPDGMTADEDAIGRQLAAGRYSPLAE